MSDRARHTPWSKKIVGIAGAGTETLDTPNDRLGRRKTVRRRAQGNAPSPAGFARRATTGWVPSASLGALSGSAKPNAMDSSSAAEANPLDPQSETTAARGSIECFAWRALLTSTIVEGSACNTRRPDAVAPRLDDAGRQPGGFSLFATEPEENGRVPRWPISRFFEVPRVWHSPNREWKQCVCSSDARRAALLSVSDAR